MIPPCGRTAQAAGCQGTACTRTCRRFANCLAAPFHAAVLLQDHASTIYEHPQHGPGMHNKPKSNASVLNVAYRHHSDHVPQVSALCTSHMPLHKAIRHTTANVGSLANGVMSLGKLQIAVATSAASSAAGTLKDHLNTTQKRYHSTTAQHQLHDAA
eukprot:GHRR01022362.1.p1 GENE.GHRR01022362.1~~GHRR01022362.1.p1  ORF type:complete len:157 (-),score=41.19 GHRR01022362.1:550-1020(-)